MKKSWQQKYPCTCSPVNNMLVELCERQRVSVWFFFLSERIWRFSYSIKHKKLSRIGTFPFSFKSAFSSHFLSQFSSTNTPKCLITLKRVKKENPVCSAKNKTHRNNRGEKCSHESSWNNFVFSSLRFSFIYWLRKSKSSRRRTSWSWSEGVKWLVRVRGAFAQLNSHENAHQNRKNHFGHRTRLLVQLLTVETHLLPARALLHRPGGSGHLAGGESTRVTQKSLPRSRWVLTVLLCNWEFCLVVHSESEWEKFNNLLVSPAPMLLTAHRHLTEWEYKHTLMATVVEPP